jgi:hypothetical protein
MDEKLYGEEEFTSDDDDDDEEEEENEQMIRDDGGVRMISLLLWLPYKRYGDSQKRTYVTCIRWWKYPPSKELS